MNEHWAKYEVKRGQEMVKRILPMIDGHGWIGGAFAAFMAAPNLTPIMPNDIDIFSRF